MAISKYYVYVSVAGVLHKRQSLDNLNFTIVLRMNLVCHLQCGNLPTTTFGLAILHDIITLFFIKI